MHVGLQGVFKECFLEPSVVPIKEQKGIDPIAPVQEVILIHLGHYIGKYLTDDAVVFAGHHKRGHCNTIEGAFWPNVNM
jgi:hypothetical protein